MSKNKPNVKIVSGNVKTIRMGFTTALITPKRTATTNNDCVEVIFTPGIIYEAT